MSRIWPPPGIFVFGVNRTLWFQSHTARRGNRITPGHVMKKKPEIKNSLMGHVAKIQTLPTYAYMNSSHFSRLRFTLKIRSVLGIANRCAYNIGLVIQWRQRIIYDCVTLIRLPSRQKGSIIILDLVKCCEILFTYFALTYQSFAYLCTVHCCMAWSLSRIPNNASHH